MVILSAKRTQLLQIGVLTSDMATADCGQLTKETSRRGTGFKEATPSLSRISRSHGCARHPRQFACAGLPHGLGRLAVSEGLWRRARVGEVRRGGRCPEARRTPGRRRRASRRLASLQGGGLVRRPRVSERRGQMGGREAREMLAARRGTRKTLGSLGMLAVR
jgi:hypothetical protein